MSDTNSTRPTIEQCEQSLAVQEELVDLVDALLGRGFDQAAIVAGIGSGISAVFVRAHGDLGFFAAARFHENMQRLNAGLAPAVGVPN